MVLNKDDYDDHNNKNYRRLSRISSSTPHDCSNVPTVEVVAVVTSRHASGFGGGGCDALPA